MEIIYSAKTNAFFAQAYGTSTYNGQTYSCVEGDVACAAGTPGDTTAPGNTTTTEAAPNTGFLGMSQDAAVASIGGALLIALALIGTAFVLVSRARTAKKKHQG